MFVNKANFVEKSLICIQKYAKIPYETNL